MEFNKVGAVGKSEIEPIVFKVDCGVPSELEAFQMLAPEIVFREEVDVV